MVIKSHFSAARSPEVEKVIAASTMEQFQLWRFFPCRDF